MRNSEKNNVMYDGSNKLLGVDLHDYIQKEANNGTYELATEFGITLGDVKKLKKQLNRN